MLNSGPVQKVEKGELEKAITMESPLCEVIIERNEMQLLEGLLWSITFKSFTQDVNISLAFDKDMPLTSILKTPLLYLFPIITTH